MRSSGGWADVLRGLALAAALGGPAAAQELDRNQVIAPLKEAFHDRFRCLESDYCFSYFDSFGVGIVFADGTTSPFDHVQRGTTSGHNCIKLAKSYLAKGDRARAVEWAIASQRSLNVREWMHQHPDAVLELLKSCCS